MQQRNVVKKPKEPVPPAYLTEKQPEITLSGECKFLLAVVVSLSIATLVFAFSTYMTARELRRFHEGGGGEGAATSMAETATDMAVSVFKRRAQQQSA